MKKLTLIVFASVLFAAHGQSQNIEYPKHQVSAFYSKGQSLYTILNDIFLSGTPDASKTEGLECKNYTDFSSVYNVAYLHKFLKPWMSMGVQLGYEENQSKRRINRMNHFKPTDKWTEKDRLPYIIAAIQFDWLRSDWVGLYMKTGAGVRLIFRAKKYESGYRDNSLDWVPCFVGISGIEVGPKIVRVFGELGLGAQGFASIGIRTRF